ncbi:MAG: 50S ribosomal protein L11 methyltransferase [Longimicrobiales bacterium]
MTAPERRWLELRVRPAAVDDDLASVLAEGLVGLGGRAVEERDGWLVSHFAEPADADSFVAEARETLSRVAAPVPIEVDGSWQAHEDWAETWKRGLEPRRLTDRLTVTPSWIPVEEAPGTVVVVVDPGMAFGTAEHGTTRGCLRLLDALVTEGESVLDVGAGSGILAVAAARLGASRVMAVEGDPLAKEAIEDNVEANGVADRVTVRAAWADAALLAALGPFDGVVANIESGVLRPLLPGLRAAVRDGGWLVLSGILDAEWPGMRRAAEEVGFRLAALDEDGPWRSASFRAPGSGRLPSDASPSPSRSGR